jgi:2,3,4,5-tetrahydropyridine-2-carboxylate N-succinyltransferase
VRIADADRVRLGAHLATGTTVMHEGFVNYNAGTLGASMVEGRISPASSSATAPTSAAAPRSWARCPAAAREVISIGERCLLGANSGIGISLGDDCIVEAGTYVTAGVKLALPDGRVVKARELSGQDNLLFRRNGLTGALEVGRPRRRRAVLDRSQHRAARERLADMAGTA